MKMKVILSNMSSKKLTVQVYSQIGEKVGEMELNSKVFGMQPKESVVHQVAVAQLANSRAAIAHTKDRSEVRGGGVKPWRQKGTGRARHGSTRSPIWVGGGVTFGPTKDRNFSQKVNKKMKTKALFMCLSDKVNQDWLILLDKLNVADGKTREIADILKSLKGVLKLRESRIKKQVLKDASKKGNKKEEAEQEDKEVKKFDIKKYKLSLLVVLPKSDRKIFNAGRNITGLKITTADSLNVVDLLRYQKVLMLADGLDVIDKIYLREK